MCFSHAEIIASMIEDVTMISSAIAGRSKPHFDEPLSFYDDEDSYMLDALDRWGDRKMPYAKDRYLTTNSTHKALILEANRLLRAA